MSGASTPSSSTAKTTGTARKAGLLSMLDTGLGSQSRVTGSTSSPHTPAKNTSDRLYASRSEATVPRKRDSEQAFPMFRDSDDTSTPGGLVKKQKPSPPLFAQPGPDVDEVRVQVSGVRSSMLHLQPQMERIARKKMKTKAEATRLRNLEAQMGALVRERDMLNARIPTATHSPKKMECSTTVPGPSPLTASSSRQRLPVAKTEQELVNVKWPLSPVAARATPLSPAVSGSNAIVDEKRKVLFGGRPTRGAENIEPEWPNMMSKSAKAHRDDDRFDEDGDFFGRGKDTFAGPIAKADDIDKFLVAAGNAEQFDGNASVDRALEKLGLRSIFDLLPGMTVALMPHQVIGVAWMLGMEKSIHRGGGMADEMGLGKTVQMMSVIVSNRSDDPMQKTTLIVAPLALLDQWQMEIESKTNCGLTCLIYHGSNKPRKKSDLLKYDVVLTTFGTLAMEWPDEEAEEKKKKKKKKKKKGRKAGKKKDDFIVNDSDSDEAPGRTKSRKQTRGLLFQIDWWRIVLDEAQNIRNRRTRVSRAVTEMSAKYRWCLTGTPIINGLSDAYGMFRFLQIRPWYDWKEYNGQVVKLEKKHPMLATDKLQVIFKSMLIRRKKDSMLDGKRLVELPSKTIELHKLEFTADEREVYKMVEVKSQAVFNRFLRAGTVLKNYHQVLVMLLRLRQICSHPSLIYEEGGAFINAGDDDTLVQPEAKSELDRAAQLVSAEFVSRMRFRFKHAALHRMQAEKESADAAVDDEECPVCLDAMVDPILTPCTHVFCRECIQNVLNSPHADDPNDIRYKADERPCPTCRGAISEAKLFSRLAFEPTDKELEKTLNPDDERVNVDNVMKKTKKGKGKAKRGNAHRMMYSSDAEEANADDIDEEEEDDGADDDDDLSDFIVQDDEDEEEKDERRTQKKRLGKARAIVLDSDNEEDVEVIYGKKSPESAPAGDGKIRLMSKFLPSTKMKHMMESIRQWAKEYPDDKILIISQWTQCLDLVSHYLTENGTLHVKYQGDMNRAKRDQAVRVFMAKDKAKVMLMSLKCGGVGLNLTRANRVISLDLGWSEAVEHQAFDRVHRLGQQRPVFVNRLVIENTVEDRILALQERKRNLAEGSLGEGAGKKIGRLSVRELANLFGMDTRGRGL
ncbi:hypothetical protein NEOLEDRAFT_625750 [Neolentinus lepideus HHB14362 ss-1]|uniref:Uncharacterized protein n=1 Tax=Neolentinus lepideus HHB14362 ss-1 TaxID=1314782 RepID=A0A165QQ35_9AGAM|nr:hypothetical protein NEOLEDRAFT_625750 [Neolentinus lepideus HHB14362 ss-1]